jgi:hypothetical protein
MISAVFAICLIFMFPNAFALHTPALTTTHDDDSNNNKAQVYEVLNLPPSQESEMLEVRRVIEVRQASPLQSASTYEASSLTYDPTDTTFPDNLLPAATTSTLVTPSNFVSTTTYNILGWQAPDNTCGYVGGSLGKFPPPCLLSQSSRISLAELTHELS